MVGESGAEQGLIPRICTSLFYCLERILQESVGRPIKDYTVTASYFEMSSYPQIRSLLLTEQPLSEVCYGSR